MRALSFTFSATMFNQVWSLVVHLELVGADDGLAGSVLDDTYNSLNSSNPFVMLGEISSEFYGGEFDVEF